MYTYNLKQSNKQISQRCWSENTEHWWWGHTGHSLSDGNMVVVTESTPQLAPYTPASPAFLCPLHSANIFLHLTFILFSPPTTLVLYILHLAGFYHQSYLNSMSLTQGELSTHLNWSQAYPILSVSQPGVLFFSVLIVVTIFVVIVKCLSSFLLCHYIKSMMVMIFSLFK